MAIRPTEADVQQALRLFKHPKSIEEIAQVIAKLRVAMSALDQIEGPRHLKNYNAGACIARKARIHIEG